VSSFYEIKIEKKDLKFPPFRLHRRDEIFFFFSCNIYNYFIDRFLHSNIRKKGNVRLINIHTRNSDMLIQSILINLGFLGLDFRDRLSRPALASPPLVAFAASSLRGRERLITARPVLGPINVILRRRGCVNTQFPTTLAFSSSPSMALSTTGLLRSDNVLAMVTSPAVSIFFFDHFLTLLRRMTPHLSFSSTPL
jgi:hypothetical protein